jgi:hypothetical protein
MGLNTDIKISSNSKFGCFFSFVLVLFSGYMYWKANLLLAISIATLSVMLFAVTLFCTQVLTPLNMLWFRLGIYLGKIVNPIVLGIIFFGLITPLSLVMKIFGRDELRLKKRSVKSFWIDRYPVGPSPDSFKDQY